MSLAARKREFYNQCTKDRLIELLHEKEIQTKKDPKKLTKKKLAEILANWEKMNNQLPRIASAGAMDDAQDQPGDDDQPGAMDDAQDEDESDGTFDAQDEDESDGTYDAQDEDESDATDDPQDEDQSNATDGDQVQDQSDAKDGDQVQDQSDAKDGDQIQGQSEELQGDANAIWNFLYAGKANDTDSDDVMDEPIPRDHNHNRRSNKGNARDKNKGNARDKNKSNARDKNQSNARDTNKGQRRAKNQGKSRAKNKGKGRDKNRGNFGRDKNEGNYRRNNDSNARDNNVGNNRNNRDDVGNNNNNNRDDVGNNCDNNGAPPKDQQNRPITKGPREIVPSFHADLSINGVTDYFKDRTWKNMINEESARKAIATSLQGVLLGIMTNKGFKVDINKPIYTTVRAVQRPWLAPALKLIPDGTKAQKRQWIANRRMNIEDRISTATKQFCGGGIFAMFAYPDLEAGMARRVRIAFLGEASNARDSLQSKCKKHIFTFIENDVKERVARKAQMKKKANVVDDIQKAMDELEEKKGNMSEEEYNAEFRTIITKRMLLLKQMKGKEELDDDSDNDSEDEEDQEDEDDENAYNENEDSDYGEEEVEDEEEDDDAEMEGINQDHYENENEDGDYVDVEYDDDENDFESDGDVDID